MSLDLVASAEVCRRLGVDRSTLTRWVAAGRIKAAGRLPGRTGAYLFEPAEVERLAATHLTGSAAAADTG